MKYHSLENSELISEYNTLWKNGVHPGYKFPIETYNYHMKPGKQTYIYAPPATGKSYVWFWKLLVFSQHYGIKHALFSPEMGTPAEIFGTLTEMLVGSKFRNDRFGVTEDQRIEAMAWLKEHFYVITGATDMNELWATVDTMRNDGLKIDSLTVDPWNALLNDPGGMRSDLFLEALLSQQIEISEERKIHLAILTHPMKLQKITQKDSGVSHYPPMSMFEIAQGQAWSRKGQMMLSLWRPPKGLHTPDGYPYDEGFMMVDIQKVKPKECGTVGTGTIYYDRTRTTYYELRDGERHYPLKQIAFKDEKPKTSAISANHDFENESDSVPF